MTAAGFVLPVIALVLALGRLDVDAVAADLSPRTPVRWVSVYMVFTGAVLAIAWTAHWAGWVFRGIEPAIGEEAFTLIASLDPRSWCPTSSSVRCWCGTAILGDTSSARS